MAAMPPGEVVVHLQLKIIRDSLPVSCAMLCGKLLLVRWFPGYGTLTSTVTFLGGDANLVCRQRLRHIRR